MFNIILQTSEWNPIASAIDDAVAPPSGIHFCNLFIMLKRESPFLVILQRQSVLSLVLYFFIALWNFPFFIRLRLAFFFCQLFIFTLSSEVIAVWFITKCIHFTILHDFKTFFLQAVTAAKFLSCRKHSSLRVCYSLGSCIWSSDKYRVDKTNKARKSSSETEIWAVDIIQSRWPNKQSAKLFHFKKGNSTR